MQKQLTNLANLAIAAFIEVALLLGLVVLNETIAKSLVSFVLC